MHYVKRNFLLLEDSEFSQKIFKSLLNLAKESVINLFNNNFDFYTKKLDGIKGFTGGVSSSKNNSEYGVAKNYPSYFAYQQYFQSSYRARQGKALEQIIHHVLFKTFGCVEYNGKLTERKQIIKNAIGFESNKDVDAVGWNEELQKLVLIQIRSRDDTGGTLAKSSLVDYAKQLLGARNLNDTDVLYILAIWDNSSVEQRNSLISKVYESLETYFPTTTKEELQEILPKHIVNLSKNLNICLTYGYNNLLKQLCNYFYVDFEDVKTLIGKTIKLIEGWDDLWLSYHITNLEMQIENFNGKNNVQELLKLLKKYNVRITKESIPSIAEFLIDKWHKTLIPVKSREEKTKYICDLLYLKLIYDKYA